MARYAAVAKFTCNAPQFVKRGGRVFTPNARDAQLYATARAASDAAARLSDKLGWPAACWADIILEDSSETHIDALCAANPYM